MTQSQNSNGSKDTCLRVLVSGRVQGVGYRYGTREKAIALGIVGWVRNLPDGRVEAMISGAAMPIDSIMKWFYNGPPAAKVTAVETEQRPLQSFEGFEIRR
ncbi:MAG: acylphosphatase [Leptolyngbya foveolarum]|jgi:acylphosphatase|uniref:acylphosphatase n=1 Tax=Leptolyngbya foveolarum TaxID=47253 RepID=A0A2W4TUV4_9CYAN|nr:MAG: acylphosphatase [Leptolyngbya foveolarum]